MIRPGDVALVTGGGRGIGRSVAAALAGAGARVAVCSRTERDVTEAAEGIRLSGGEALALRCDVADPDQVAAMVQDTVRAFGRIDVLVNNAGVGTVAPSEVADYEVAEWDRIVDTNLRGTFLCCRAVLPGMRDRRRGTIVNVASITGLKSAPFVAPYGAGKFGVVGLTQALLAENHRYGIRVSLVHPGPTDTTIWDKKRTLLGPEIRAAMMRPADVAHVVLFLAALPDRVRIDDIVVLPNQFPLRLWDYRVE